MLNQNKCYFFSKKIVNLSKIYNDKFLKKDIGLTLNGAALKFKSR